MQNANYFLKRYVSTKTTELKRKRQYFRKSKGRNEYEACMLIATECIELHGNF